MWKPVECDKQFLYIDQPPPLPAIISLLTRSRMTRRRSQLRIATFTHSVLPCMSQLTPVGRKFIRASCNATPIYGHQYPSPLIYTWSNGFHHTYVTAPPRWFFISCLPRFDSHPIQVLHPSLSIASHCFPLLHCFAFLRMYLCEIGRAHV